MSKEILKNICNFVAIGAMFSCASLSAWQRAAQEDCQKSHKQCMQNVENCKDSGSSSDQCAKMEDMCKQNMKECKANIEKKDLASFEAALSSYSRTTFAKFSNDQKKKAMDYADKNTMSPDDAVTKVATSK